MSENPSYFELFTMFLASPGPWLVVKWWAWLLLPSILFFPLVRRMFPHAVDRAWPVAKVLSIALPSCALWLASSAHLVPFNSGWTIVAMLLVLPAFGWIAACDWREFSPLKRFWFYVFLEEALFLGGLICWAFIRSLRPDIQDLEKFMDFGFINSCLRTDYFPAQDMWFAGQPINYYYYGQYLCAFAIRWAGEAPALGPNAAAGYNLCLATLFGFALVTPFSFGANAIAMIRGRGGIASVGAGLVSGAMIALGGNLHTFLYGFMPKLAGAMGWKYEQSVPFEWAACTRFIGYVPATTDKTISEFCSYSFVVADLHGHMIDVMLVMCLLLMLLLMVGAPRLQRIAKKGQSEPRAPANGPTDTQSSGSPVRSLTVAARIRPYARAEFLVFGAMLGMFFMTNMWDYPVFMLVTGFAVLIRNLWTNRILPAIGWTAGQMAVVLGVSVLVWLPFWHYFVAPVHTPAYAPVHARSPFWQLLVLYGYQWSLAAVCLILLGLAIWRRTAKQNSQLPIANCQLNDKSNAAPAVPSAIRPALPRATPGQVNPQSAVASESCLHLVDAFMLLLLAASIVAIIIPEIIYFKDIYGTEYQRANTMFKFGYQAVMLLSLMTGYWVIRILTLLPWIVLRIFAGVMMAGVLAMPLMFLPYAIGMVETIDQDHKIWGYYERIKEPHADLDGVRFIKEMSPEDYAMIEFLNDPKTPPGNILEADGQSYESSYLDSRNNCNMTGKISMATGRATPLGWFYHEKLWRFAMPYGAPFAGDAEEEWKSPNNILSCRGQGIYNIYTSPGTKEAKESLEKYHVRFIIIGRQERAKYTYLDEAGLEKLGKVVFRRAQPSASSGAPPVYSKIIEVQ